MRLGQISFERGKRLSRSDRKMVLVNIHLCTSFHSDGTPSAVHDNTHTQRKTNPKHLHSRPQDTLIFIAIQLRKKIYNFSSTEIQGQWRHQYDKTIFVSYQLIKKKNFSSWNASKSKSLLYASFYKRRRLTYFSMHHKNASHNSFYYFVHLTRRHDTFHFSFHEP